MFNIYKFYNVFNYYRFVIYFVVYQILFLEIVYFVMWIFSYFGDLVIIFIDYEVDES